MKKSLIFIFILLCSGCAMGPYYDIRTGRMVDPRIKSKKAVEEIPSWASDYIDKTGWYHGSFYSFYKNDQLESQRLEPLTVKEITIRNINAYDGKGYLLNTMSSTVLVVFKELAPISCAFGSKDRFIENFFWENPYTEIHPNWSPQTWKLIKERKIKIGMTKEQVELSWGKIRYRKEDEYVSAGYVKETYCHGKYYLTFVNGILDSWYEPNY